MIRYKYKIFVSRGEEILLIKEYLNIVKPMMETVEGSRISWGPKETSSQSSVDAIDS